MSDRNAHDEREPRAGLPPHLWIAIGVFATSLLVQLSVRTEVIRIAYALEQERQLGEQLRAEHDRLALEQTARGSTKDLVERAKQLGMRLATPADIEPVHPDRGTP